MKHSRAASLRILVAAVVLTGSLQACAAKNVTTDWPTECVGRMQLQLPGAADVAAYTGARLSEELDEGRGQ